MGRKKLEIKLIEDKNRRQVTFCKRRAGLKKKARQLSVLCEVDVAVVVFSSHGKLYEYCSGGTDRYEKSCLEAEEETTTQQEEACNDLFNNRFRTCKELLESVKRLDEDPNELSVADMTMLEEELSHALLHTRSRKTELLMEQISTFHEQERKLTQEKDELKQQEASEKQKEDDVDDDAATTHISPLPLTLSLFPESNQ